ncbi:MATE family efflux transporter [Sphingomonas sp. BIUV-7]|uniref:MATE family efflux transporter n=1 Tax=Sphingomonas natans TaxID=3063330 RepID=A0ABT8Y609_9SPHN|nr:MATE family efflux transporter [Sphingomonas sp. BIUV-7]MDO6413756.1 MATE family efflux transporter [Sphingomonas sp. BIUV-7]
MAAGTGARAPRDLTTGPITRTLLLFSLPTLGANILQSLNGSINTVWVGRFLGEAALAATSNANIIMFLMFSLGFGFGMAATILMGQSIGARDIVGARRALGTGVGMFAIISVLIAIVGWLSADAILRVLATPPAAHALALAYLRVIFLGLPPMFLMLLFSMGLRAIGDAMTPLRFMILNVVLDAGLNPVLILGLGPFPRMGIAGAATATLIANYGALLGLVLYIYAKDIAIRLKGPELRFLLPDPALLRIIVTKGLPMALQMLVMTLSGLVMIGLINREGVDVAAAYGVAQLLWTYVQMPAMAIGAAVSAMAAQNIGAGAWHRIDRITRSGILVNLALTGSIVALLLLFDKPALSLFLGSNSPAIPIARHIQFLASWSFIIFGVTMVLFSAVRANGAVIAPLLILAAGVFGARLAFAWAFLPFGQDILWWSFPVGSSVTVVLALLYYRFGDWRKPGLVARTVHAEVVAEGVA